VSLLGKQKKRERITAKGGGGAKNENENFQHCRSNYPDILVE